MYGRESIYTHLYVNPRRLLFLEVEKSTAGCRNYDFARTDKRADRQMDGRMTHAPPSVETPVNMFASRSFDF